MLRLLEKLRTRTDNVIRMYYDKPIVEQIDAIKKTTGTDTHLSIMLHKYSVENSWNPISYKQLSEEIDKRYSFKKDSYKNMEDIIFNYLDGWIIKEDIFWVFYDKGNDLYYDPTDGGDKLAITYFLTQKIKNIFPVEDNAAFNLANDFINFKLNEEGLENEKFYPRPNPLMEGVLNEYEDRRLNPPIKPGDHIRLISVDYDALPPSEYEEDYMTPEHLDLGKVDEVYQDETPNGEEVTMIRVFFPNLEYIGPEGSLIDDGIRLLVDPYDKYVKTDEVLTEAGIIGGNDGKSRPAIPDNLRKNLVRARFERPGGWGRPGHTFILYITPMGKIMDISYGAQTSRNVVPFQINQQVKFGDLYRFEQDSPFDLRMFGRLREQDEQLNLFPLGDWEFPVGFEDWKQKNGEIIAGSDQETADWIRKIAPDRLVSKIFKMWDENGIDFSNFKLLGLPNNGMLQTFLLKRYIQNSKTPIPVSASFDCDDLVGLFNTDSRDYNLDYIKEYLCGDDSFWDSQDWYHYEWESHMSDAIDENNWKTISEIFGGVSQSVAEDILTRNSSSEEVDELIEKYDEEIDEIQNFIVWANSDETEWATKDAMATDIKDKIEEHFNGVGRLMNDNKGAFSYTIDGDIRDEVNDIWDNTEDVFQHHPDYTSDTLEAVLMSMSDSAYTDYNVPNMLFDALMDEEYKFWDYCEGKAGDCLEVSTRFMDGYWYPDIDINDSLSDRLGELTYEPQITTPLDEQQSIWGNGVVDREKEWCEDDENWLCNTGSENLGFSDLYKDDGHDIIHNFPGNVHLSDLSPEEKETRIPNKHKKKKYKKLKLNPDLSVGPFNISALTEQEKKTRFKTIYENENWKYVWPIGVDSFCEIASGTTWCKVFGDNKWFETRDGTHYILIDKNTNNKYDIVDTEKVPGMPSYKVSVYDNEAKWMDTHRFLADKPTLHELFSQTYTILDKIRYKIDIPKEELDNFYKKIADKDGGELLDLVYKIIKNPNLDGLKGELEEKYNGGLTVLSPDEDPVLNSIRANNEYLSIYLMDGDFKEKWMNVGDDDDWYFDLGSGRYYDDDHCEELEDEEINYIGNYMDEENIKRLNSITEMMDEEEEDWTDESAIDEFMTKYFKNEWEEALWRIVDRIGCAVGRNRVKGMREHIEDGKIFDYEFVGSNNYPLWELKITYPELLYLIGIYKVDNIEELENHEINELDGGLNDVWWDSWDIKGGEEDINWEMRSFLDGIEEKYQDKFKNLGANLEKFEKLMKEFGFQKPYREWTLKQTQSPSIPQPYELERIITIKGFDIETGKIHIDVQGNDEQGRWQTKQHQTTLDGLPEYVTHEQLFESI